MTSPRARPVRPLTPTAWILSLFALFTVAATPASAAEHRSAVRYKVNSTVVAWVVYDEKTGTLLVARREGGATEYYHVPKEQFQSLMANDFMGGFMKANIDRKYPSRMVRVSRPANAGG